jgi:amino acid transporter
VHWPWLLLPLMLMLNQHLILLLMLMLLMLMLLKLMMLVLVLLLVLVLVLLVLVRRRRRRRLLWLTLLRLMKIMFMLTIVLMQLQFPRNLVRPLLSKHRLNKCPLFWQLKTAADIACCREILPAREPGRQGAYRRALTMLMLILFGDLRIFHFSEWLVLAWVHLILAQCLISTFCHESTINLFHTVDRSDTAMPLSLKNLKRRLLLSVMQRRSRRLAKLRGINHSRSG